MSASSLPNTSSPSAAYERALEEALTERTAISDQLKAARQAILSLEAREAELIRAIETLLPLVDADKRQSFQIPDRSIQKFSHGTDAFNKIVFLVQRYPDRQWTTPDLQEALEKEGIKAEVKQIYNILAYLQKDGRLQRVDRGKYRLRDIGAGLVTSDDLAGTDDGGVCS
jgi:hypothetical protein